MLCYIFNERIVCYAQNISVNRLKRVTAWVRDGNVSVFQRRCGCS